MKISIELPFFPGFYESDLENSDTSYWAIKNELEYYQDPYTLKEHPEYKGLTEDDLDFNHSDYEKDMTEAFMNAWREYAPEIVESVEFDEIVSPKYYNFSTDRLFATVELRGDWQDIMRTFMSENAEWLKKRIKDDWTSYDGFCSFMDNDSSEWERHLFVEQDGRYISTMLGYMMYRENDDIRNDIVFRALDSDVYPESYVFITDEAKERMEDDIREGRVIAYDPAQLELPFEW